MIRITIACPEALVADAEEFARATGYTEADAQTFALAPVLLDADGNRYRVASGLVADSYVEVVSAPLEVPEWGADMIAATRAQAALAVWAPPEEPPEDDEESEPFAAPDRIAVVISDDVQGALRILGVGSQPIIGQRR